MIARLAAAFLGALALLLGVSEAHAQSLVADLTNHLVAITTGFTGANVVLFGSSEQKGDLIVVVQGPTRDIVVRHKTKVAAIWINTTQVTFRNVPTFYSIASTRPLGEIAPPELLRAQQIGLDSLRLTPEGNLEPEQIQEFRAALIRNQEEAKLYLPDTEPVTFAGEHLFRTKIAFPANVPTGDFLVHVFLLRDHALIEAQTLTLTVSQVGFDARVHDFADRNALAYGIIAAALAALAGWLASLPFRNA